MLYARGAYSMDNFFFSHLGVKEGLSQVSVLNIYQDSDGYIWFGTRNGANRYDGYEFSIYQNEVNNPASLSDNYIRCFAEDKEKNMYIGTANGLNRIDRKTGRIDRFYPRTADSSYPTNSISKLLLHPDGTLYIFCSHYVLQWQSGKLPERTDYLKEVGSPVTAVAQGADGDMYIGTYNTGLYIYSSDWKLQQHISSDVGNRSLLPGSSITALFAQEDGQVWIGTDEEGLYLFDRSTQKLSHLNKSNTRLSNNSIRTLIRYNDNSLLIGTFAGLNILNQEDLSITPVRMDITGKGNLSHYSIHSMLIDKDQTLWVGTYSAGVNYHSPFYKPASYITPNEFTGITGKGQEDKDGNMWFATEGAGLFCYNPENGMQKLYPIKHPHKSNYEMNIIKSILLKGDSILCATHFGSVYLFSIRNKTYKMLYNFKHNDIYSLFLDSSGRLYIPTHNDNHLVMIENGKAVNRFPSDGSARSFQSITTIKEIEPGKFIFGSLSDSLFVYDRNEQTTINLSATLLSKYPQGRLGSVTAILQDRNGFIYIATNKNGLYRLNKQLEQIKQYQKEDGLAESYISTLTLDKNGQLWVTTGRSLYKLDKQTDTFAEVYPGEAPPLEFSLYSGNSTSVDGTLYFPGDKGILAFNPEKLTVNPNIPTVHITSLVINNREEITGQAAQQTIILKAGQNNITFKYTALNFIHSEKNQYTFRLEGADPTWHMVGNRREAYYSNLAPGHYVFKVKASNNDGVWNPTETELHLTINPPLYKTWWAYLLYISLLTFLIFRVIHYQHNKHERERNARYKQMEQDKMNELHKERIRMFTNFSHELRTPLTLIINPLSDLMQCINFSPEVKNLLQMIKKNSARMLLLVNNLMDIQKYEAGKMILQKSRFNFSAFMQEIYHSFESIANNREITFTLLNKLPDTYFVSFDESEIEQVFFNLLSNAFKFTPSGGKVTISIDAYTKQTCKLMPELPPQYSHILIERYYLLIEVANTGKVLDQKDTEKIFEPFYHAQEDIHQQISGTGIGLSLARSIVQQHNGCIWAESSKEKGTRFLFFLPSTEKNRRDYKEYDEPAPQPSETYQKVNQLIEEEENKNKQTLLLVDDNHEVLQYLEQQLSHNYIIRTAINGKDALAKITHSAPHLVVSDVMMPEMNGIELCKQIKENKDNRYIPVILLTAKSMVSQIEEGLEAGADDYIVKPFHISLLKARIKSILNTYNKMKSFSYDDTDSRKELGIEEPQKNDSLLTQCIQIIKANISNQELDISLLCQKLGLSRANFYRKIHAETDLSPIELIKNIRLETGARLLEESEMNISEIAQYIGFSSRTYFARSFKETYGVSPTKYKENLPHTE